MRLSELLRIVWLNIVQNKFKVLLTSVGIIVGAATIVMVIAVGKGGQEEVASQFKNLNAGAIDISYAVNGADNNSNEKSGISSSNGMPSRGGMPFGGGMSPGGDGMPSGGRGMPSGGGNSFFIGGNRFDEADSMLNKEKITLTQEDVEDIQVFIPKIDSVTISFSTKTEISGGELEEETSYTVAGVKDAYAKLSNLNLQVGDFITSDNDENKEKICILGATVAEEIFENAIDAYDSTIYIDGRPYVINGILEKMGTVSSGISPDEAVFIPYGTGVKYITGNNVSPTITVIASNVNEVDKVIENVETVLAQSYPNTTFTITDAGSKMEAASASNNTLTLLLIVMAAIVFLVGGIGIMNVLFVSVKERTREIGILKAIGCSKRDILIEFLLEAAMISVFGGILGVGISFVVLPIAEHFNVSVSASVEGSIIAILFAIVTGTIFGFYPALKAASLRPIEALAEE